jgi:hypothetical protein
MTTHLDEIRSILDRTPKTLRAMLDGLPEAWLSATEGPNTYSPRDVVGHLIHGEDTDWMPRVRTLLAHGEDRPFDPFDREGYGERARTASIADLLAEFEDKRVASLRALDELTLVDADLTKRGRHPALGIATLRQLLSTWAVHDLNHIGQIVRVMSRRYDAEVGPWKQYLGILNR